MNIVPSNDNPDMPEIPFSNKIGKIKCVKPKTKGINITIKNINKNFFVKIFFIPPQVFSKKKNTEKYIIGTNKEYEQNKPNKPRNNVKYEK